jgi:hypothetical protein
MERRSIVSRDSRSLFPQFPRLYLMKRISLFLFALVSLVAPTFAADALRVMVASDASAAGAKLQSELVATLNSHGAKASAVSETGPLGDADVLVLYGADMKALSAE